MGDTDIPNEAAAPVPLILRYETWQDCDMSSEFDEDDDDY